MMAFKTGAHYHQLWRPGPSARVSAPASSAASGIFAALCCAVKRVPPRRAVRGGELQQSLSSLRIIVYEGKEKKREKKHGQESPCAFVDINPAGLRSSTDEVNRKAKREANVFIIGHRTMTRVHASPDPFPRISQMRCER